MFERAELCSFLGAIAMATHFEITDKLGSYIE